MTKRLILTLFLFSFTCIADDVNQDVQTWFTAVAKTTLKDDIHLSLEINPRFTDDTSETGLLLMRGNVDYDLFPSLRIGGGYTWTHAFQKPSDKNDEHRIHEQLTHHIDLGNHVVLTNRIRVEQRFFEGRSASDVAVRLRYLLRGQVPLVESGRLTAVAWNEVWFNLNTVSSGPKSGFDQNWSFLGLNVGLTKELHLELGYMLAYVLHPGEAEDDLNHVMMVTVSYDF